MAQDEDLNLVGSVGAGVQHHPAQQLREHLVDQLHRHRRIMPWGRSAVKHQVSDSAQRFGHPQAGTSSTSKLLCSSDSDPLAPVLIAISIRSSRDNQTGRPELIPAPPKSLNRATRRISGVQ
jgi:hypothetical protein